MKSELSLAEGRRMALTAQGFNGLSRDQPIGPVQLRRTIRQLGLLQIDSVNVLVRAHYMPLFSRLGAYDRATFNAMLPAQSKHFFEYWGHEASLLPLDCHPLLRWRMARALRGQGVWKRLEPYAYDRRSEAQALLDLIEAEGPLAASDVASSRGSKSMWVWSETKHTLEWLFWAGLVAATHRRSSFERVYDLPERVLPRTILEQPTPTETDAHRTLLARAAKALGVATVDDLRDYYRLSVADVRLPIEQLVEERTIIPIRVQGWKQPAYVHQQARVGRRIEGAVLLSPFDPLIWHRRRTERLFGFRYRLEIYTPAHKREYGYYVLPFLLDGALVARVDLKADRKTGVLLVQQTHVEPGAPPDTLERLNEELRRMASWLGLPRLYTK